MEVVSKVELTAEVVGTMKALHSQFLRAVQIKAWLDRYSSAEISSMLGFTEAEVDEMKTAINVAVTMWEEDGNNLRAFGGLIWGLGL